MMIRKLEDRHEEEEGRLAPVLRQAFPAAAPSPELEARLRARATAEAAFRTGRHRTRRVLLLRGAVAAAGLAAAVGAFSLRPHDAAAEALSRMEDSLDRVRTCRQTITTYGLTSDGELRGDANRIVIYYSAGRWRTERDDEPPHLFADGRHWRFDAGEGRYVSEVKDSPFPLKPTGWGLQSIINSTPSTGWTVESLERVSAPEGERLLLILRNSYVDELRDPRRGRPAIGLVDARILIFIDPQTDLPDRLEYHHLSRGEWVPHGSGKFEFDVPLDEALFDPESLPAP